MKVGIYAPQKCPDAPLLKVMNATSVPRAVLAGCPVFLELCILPLKILRVLGHSSAGTEGL